MGAEETILSYFFSNSDKPIYTLKNLPEPVQNYLYMGVSRFPNIRQRFLKMLKDKECFEQVAEAVKEGNKVEEAMKPLSDFSAEKNAQIFFEFGHKSAGEGSTLFFVSEENPIYATEIQQDFYYPITTMELSTRYSRKFSLDRVYFDPKLMASKFADQAKEVIEGNLTLYENGFDLLMQRLKEKRSKEELPEKVSVLDSLRFLIPVACHTVVILGGNTRSTIDHFGKLLTYDDSFTQEYTKACIAEASKTMPDYYSGIKPDPAVIEREKSLQALGDKLFEKKFSPVKESVKMFYDLPTEELVLAQILYPYCNVTFNEVLEKTRAFGEKEKKEVFEAATLGRKNRSNPIRGFATRPIVFEVESAWAMWKDFKRNRMNLRFQQPMRGLAGFETPELIQNSEIEKEYSEAMQKTSDLIEKIFQEHGSLSRTVAAQGSNKRYLLCMGARQLTVLTELRTSGEGDKGYRKISSKLIDLAKEKNPAMFAHIKDNFKNPVA